MAVGKVGRHSFADMTQMVDLGCRTDSSVQSVDGSGGRPVERPQRPKPMHCMEVESAGMQAADRSDTGTQSNDRLGGQLIE